MLLVIFECTLVIIFFLKGHLVYFYKSIFHSILTVLESAAIKYYQRFSKYKEWNEVQRKNESMKTLLLFTLHRNKKKTLLSEWPTYDIKNGQLHIFENKF